MTFVIGLSGPPGSGKDAIGKQLVEILQTQHRIQPYVTALAEPLRHAAGLIVGADVSTPEAYAAAKDTPFDAVGGLNLRQLMISLTEDYLKPRYGVEIWALNLVERVRLRGPDVVIIPDVGFSYERKELEWHFRGKAAFAQLERPGTDYSQDSRRSIWRGPGDPNCINLFNPGTNIQQLQSLAGRIHDYVLNHLSWNLPNYGQPELFEEPPALRDGA